MNSEQSNQTQNKSVIYINPKTDFGFKRLFMEGVRAKIRLLDLLKTFFPKPLRHVNRIVFDPSELLGDTEQKKRIVLDILATIDDKTEALVEMQRAVMEHFAERSIFYACRLVSKSLNRGDEYDLPNVLALFITEKPLPVFEGFDGFFHTVQLRSLDGKIFSEKIMLGYLDLSKFAALNPGQLKDMQFADRQEKWGYILANIEMYYLTDFPSLARTLPQVRPSIFFSVPRFYEKVWNQFAATDAGDFADLFLRPGFDGGSGIPDFAAAAAKLGLAVSTTALFSADEPPVSPDLANDFAASVFALEIDGEPSDRVSGVVGEEDSSEYFVAELLEISESHVPDYADLADRVLADAREDKASRAFQDEVSRVQEALLRAVENGGSFAETAATNGLEVGTNFVFTARDAFGDAAPVASPHQVAQSMMQLGAGDLSPAPIAVPGGVLFFQVVSREPGDASLAGTYRDSIVYGLESQTADALWDDWLERNLDAMDPKPATPFEPAAGAEPDEEEKED